MYYIYRITNLINGKTYIGQHKYKKLDDNYMGSGVYLKVAKAKYGIENFKKEILYSNIQYKETADDMEKFAIAKERAIGKAEYNIADGGNGVIGYHHTEESKKKMSEARKGKSPWNKGKKLGSHSEEHKKKISESEKGREFSEKTKKRISEALKGKHLSEEHKRSLSKINKGKKLSDDTKTKMSELRKGRHWYNNGRINKFCFECPDGFTLGKI